MCGDLIEETLADCAIEEDFCTELLDHMTALCLGWIKACADIPADGIMLGDDWGDQRGVLIGPARWKKFFKPRYARVFKTIHDQGKVALLHCCGSVQPEAAGMNPYELKRGWGETITFWGCLGSQSTIPFGTPTELREEIRRLRRG